MVGGLQRHPEIASKQLMMAKGKHLLFELAEQLTEGVPPQQTYSDGEHETRLDGALANKTSKKAAIGFEVSRIQVLPKHEMLEVDTD